MREYQYALSLITSEPVTFPPVEQIKSRLDRLERLRDLGGFNRVGDQLITRAIISSSIDLGQAFEHKHSNKESV